MRLEGISYDDLIISSISLIGTCMKRDFVKLINMSVRVVYWRVYGTNNFERSIDLCIFGRPYSLSGKEFMGFNVDLILEMLLCFIRVLVGLCAIMFIGFLLSLVYALSRKRIFIFFF